MINQQPMGEYVWHYMNIAFGFSMGDGNYFHQHSPGTGSRMMFGMRRGGSAPGQSVYYSKYLQAWEPGGIGSQYEGVREWKDVVEKLKSKHSGDVKVAVYPYAGMQFEVGATDVPDEDEEA